MKPAFKTIGWKNQTKPWLGLGFSPFFRLNKLIMYRISNGITHFMPEPISLYGSCTIVDLDGKSIITHN